MPESVRGRAELSKCLKGIGKEKYSDIEVEVSQPEDHAERKNWETEMGGKTQRV